ncbi:MAG: glycosyltransferase family 9 protein [Kiritimatiellia bacterium]
MPDVSRILVVKLSALGDLLHAVPVAHRLAEHYQCPVDWVTQPEYVELVTCHRDVDRVIAFPRRGGISDMRNFVRDLRKQTYDLALDLQGLSKSGLVLGLSRSRRKIGTSRPRELSAWFAQETPESKASTPHAMDRLFDSLRHLGIEPGPAVYPLEFPPGPEFASPIRKLAIAPRSRWPGKDWPEDRFVELARTLMGQLELEVYVLGGPSDRELGERMVADIGEGSHTLCGKHPMSALGGILRQMDCLVCNDSGPMHMGAAVGTPLVALFGPTDPEKTGPWGSGHRVLRPPAGAEGYPDHRHYKRTGNSFISQLSVQEVEKAVKSQLRIG